MDNPAMQHERVAHGFPKQRMVILPSPVVRQALAKPVMAALLPTDIGHFPSAASHYVQRTRGVSAAVLIYCVRGQGWVEMAGQRSEVQEDQIVIIPPGQPHAYGAGHDKPWTIYWCHFCGSHLQPLLKSLDISAGRPLLESSDAGSLIPIFEQLLTMLETGYTQSSLLIASLTLGHFFGRLLATRGQTHIGDIAERIEATIALMKRSISGSVHVGELAAMAKVSPSHYAVLFKQRTGYAVIDFFIRLKMQEACRLLDMTSLPIKTIADRLGYEDALYFSRAFRKVIAMPPSAYRALHKG